MFPIANFLGKYTLFVGWLSEWSIKPRLDSTQTVHYVSIDDQEEMICSWSVILFICYWLNKTKPSNWEQIAI